MFDSNSLVPKHHSIDIGDLRVNFLGTSRLLQAEQITSSPLHLHSKHEFQYIISGTFQESVNADEAILIKEGSAIIIPPNMLHSNPSTPGKRLIVTLALQQRHTDDTGADFSEYAYYCRLFGSLQNVIVLHNDIITYCISQLLALSDSPENVHKRKTLLSMLFTQIGECIKNTCGADVAQFALQPGTQYNQQYFLIEQHINTHYNKKTSVDEIAELLHISRRQADRIVIQIFGKTYANLVTERRMSIAQTLLQKTDISCTQVAEKIGYSSYAGFYTAFHQHFGVSPDELRESMKA